MFNKKKNKVNYISELNLPSYSAYSIHVMKMCEAFSKLGFKTNLYTISKSEDKKILNSYNIKHNFNIISVFNNPYNLNFFFRLFFLSKILLKGFKKNEIFITRSILFGLISTIFRKNIYLELHHEITGLTNYIYKILNFFDLLNNLKFIFLHKKLGELYKINKKRFIVLDDAVDIIDFKIKQPKKIKKSCVYLGSFFKGKGVEQIFRLAKKNKKINFHLYGDFNQIKDFPKLKNIKYFGHINYSSVPKTLLSYEIALMPYQNKVKGRASIWLEKYMSPLKMFDYMAAGLIILASDLPVYKHLMKNNYNCKLLEVNNDIKWSHEINQILKNKKKYNHLKKNALKTAAKYTWVKRAQKILNF